MMFALVLVSLFSCQRLDDLSNLDEMGYDAEYAIPLLQGRLSMQDALETFKEASSLTIDEDGLIRFQYSGNVISQNSDTIFRVINDELSGIPIPLNRKRKAMPLELNTPDGLDFDLLVIKEGKFAFGFQHEHPDEVSFTITLPQVTKNGNPLSFQAELPGYDGTGTLPTYTTAFLPADLSGYEVRPDAATDSVYIEYELIRSDGLADTIAFGAITFLDLKFSYMEGFLGIQTHEGGRDTIEIDFFDNWVQGDIYFAEPSVTFNIVNSFGIPTRSRVNVFKVFTVRADTLPLESPFVENGIDFPYPTIDEVGQIKEEQFVFNKDNSNIDVILGAGPLAIDYDVDAVTNPDSNTLIRGFITDESFYRVQVEVDLPLYGKSIDFLARDTFDINLSDYEQASTAEFKLVTENELPIGVELQGYFYNENGILLDSLFEAEKVIISAAPVDDLGVASTAQEEVLYIDFPEDRFANLRRARQLVILAQFTTTNEGQQAVKVFAEQGVDIKLGVILGIRR